MKILLSRSGGIGDCLLTLPLARYLKSTHPDCTLHALGNPSMLSVARLSGLFDSFYSIDNSMFAGLFSEKIPAGALHSYLSVFDNVIMLSSSEPERLQSCILDAGAGACHVIDPRPTSGLHVHIVRQLLSKYTGDDPENIPVPGDYGLPHAQRASSGNYLIVHPGSGSIQKNWPLERFLAVSDKCGSGVRFVCGPAENERGLVSRLKDSGVPFLLPGSLEELQAILLEGGLFLGNDSGTAHFAAALKIPTIVLFGPTEPAVWRPLGDNVTFMTSPDKTMEGIVVGDVLNAVRNVKTL